MSATDPELSRNASEMLLLVDGHALVHRAFHAVPPLSTTKGELVNAVYGFALMLLKAINELRPQYVAVAFDKAAPTFRHLEYEEYKAHRPPAPEGLHQQLARVRELTEALSIPIYEIEGWEADDVLGTLARQATERGLSVVIATGDADALQLVGPSVRVMVPLKGFSETTTYDEVGVRQRYGLAPEQIPDYKALKGDPSDNIKGVPGVGDKTAARLLAEFGTVESLLARLDDAPPKLRPLLAEHADEARQSKRLATIVTDVPVQLDLAKCRAGAYDRPRVVGLFRELEFRSLLSRLPDLAPQPPLPTGEGIASEVSPRPEPLQMDLFGEIEPAGQAPAAPLSPMAIKVGARLGDYRVVDSPAALDDLARELAARPGFVVDVETTDVNPMRAKLVGIAVAVEPGAASYVPVGHRAGEQLPLDLVAAKLRPLLADAGRGKYGHNLKYDAIVLDRHGMPLRGLAFDTMVATYLLESSQRALNLKDVAFAKLGVEMTPITDLIGKGKSQITMAEVPIPAVAAYAGADADVTLRLMRRLEPELRQQSDLWRLFEEVEMPLVLVLAAMEEAGVALDCDFLEQMSRDLAGRIGALEAEIYDLAGHRFNVNSTQQLAGVLFQELHLPPSRRTKTGQSTDAETLEALRGAHPIVERILEHRQLVKLKSTYVDALPALINPATGRVHTSFNQTGTTTGRLSSSDPNLQNIPIRTDLGRQVRRAFVVGQPGYCLLGADYSQIELRILAHITRDERLVAAFEADEDIHAATASRLFGVKLRDVTPDQRRMAKTTNFGVIYGISDYGLSQQLGIPRKDAAEFIQSYFAKYPTIRDYLSSAIRQAQEHGYVTTLLGRRRFIPEINVANQAIRNAAERMAINTPIQGTAADVIKVAMVRLHREMQRRGLRSRMILQVHDELVFEGPEEELAELRPLVVEMMEGAYTLSVPLKVDIKTGADWGDLG